MANAQYHKLPNNEYMNLGAAGAPVYFKVIREPADGFWYPSFTYNGGDWLNFVPATPFTTQAAAQAALDSFITNYLGGIIGP